MPKSVSDSESIRVEIAAFVRHYPDRFREAGAWLDREYSVAKCLERDLAFYPENYSRELPSLESWKSKILRLRRAVSGLLDDAPYTDKANPRVPPSLNPYYYRVLLVEWLCVDPEAFTLKPPLTEFQDMACGKLPHDLMHCTTVSFDSEVWRRLCRGSLKVVRRAVDSSRFTARWSHLFHLSDAAPVPARLEGDAMTTQQNQEWAAKFGKLRSQIKANQLGLPDEVWASKDEPSSRCGGFDLDGVLKGPGPRVPGKAGKAALAAAFFDVVTEGEGIEPMGLWHDQIEREPDEREPKEREPKDKLAAAVFHAMMDRVRQGRGLPLTVLEQCLSSLVSSADHEAEPPSVEFGIDPYDEFKSAQWFTLNTKVSASRLRKAANPKRKTKHVRKKILDGVDCYSRSDAVRWWPKDMPALGISAPDRE